MKKNDQKNSKKVVLVIGASSGIGRECAGYLAQRGFVVYGGSRSAESIQDDETGIRHIHFDVTSDEAVTRSISKVIEQEGKIDIVINSAGICVSGPVELIPNHQAFAQMETNFRGIFRVCQTILPYMREQKSGLIINISSIGGLIALPFNSFYSASKFALEGFSESLRLEVAKWNIKVVLVQPGDMKTPITFNRKVIDETPLLHFYKNTMDSVLQMLTESEQNGPEPIKIARLVHKIIKTKNPRLRYVAGTFIETLAVALKRVIPQTFFEWLIRKHYKLEA